MLGTQRICLGKMNILSLMKAVLSLDTQTNAVKMKSLDTQHYLANCQLCQITQYSDDNSVCLDTQSLGSETDASKRYAAQIQQVKMISMNATQIQYMRLKCITEF